MEHTVKSVIVISIKIKTLTWNETKTNGTPKLKNRKIKITQEVTPSNRKQNLGITT